MKIGSVSQYADISLVKNGKETKLSGFPERDEIMGDEAIKFADYIEKARNLKPITTRYLPLRTMFIPVWT